MENVFAEVRDGLIINIIAVSSSDCGEAEFPESESIGIAFLSGIGLTGNYMQSSPTGAYRNNPAAIGGTYDPVTDEFILPPIRD
jgi:hypothetical protein